jgi:hypothetical protein
LLRVGKGANGGSTEFGGDLDPCLDALHALGPGGRSGGGEVVADAGAADGEAEIEGMALETDQVIVGGGLGITGEKVAGEIDRVEADLGAKVAGAEQVESLGFVFGVRVEELEEGIDVERRTQVRAAVARDCGLGATGGCRRAGQRQREEGGGFKERTAGGRRIHVGGGWNEVRAASSRRCLRAES